jgi:hypothetical protein
MYAALVDLPLNLLVSLALMGAMMLEGRRFIVGNRLSFLLVLYFLTVFMSALLGVSFQNSLDALKAQYNV